VLNVNSTALIQFVVVVLFVLAMYVLFFKPVTRLIEAREEHIQGSTKDAEHANQKSSEVLNTYLSKIETARKQEIERMVEARRQALEHQSLAIETARQEAQKLVGQGLAQIQEGVVRSSATLRDQAQEMSRMIAGRILGRRILA